MPELTQDDGTSDGVSRGAASNGSSNRGASSGDRPSTPPDDRDDAPFIPAGTLIDLTLDEELSTESSSTGDRFTATVERPITVDDYLMIEAGTKVAGLVTAVQKPDGDRPGVIKLDVVSVELPGGVVPLEAEVQSVETEIEKGSSTAEDAARIGVTTAAGAILGRVIGGSTESTVIGAAVGAAAGTAIVLTSGDDRAVLARGSTMTIRLLEPLRLDRSGS